MPNIKLKVVSTPTPMKHIVLDSPPPGGTAFMSGEGAGYGDINYVCGKCGTILIEHMNSTFDVRKVGNMQLRCAQCGSYNTP
jgi:hypothetical protein